MLIARSDRIVSTILRRGYVIEFRYVGDFIACIDLIIEFKAIISVLALRKFHGFTAYAKWQKIKNLIKFLEYIQVRGSTFLGEKNLL